MSAARIQSSLIEKGLLFCGYGGMALSALVGVLSLVGALVTPVGAGTIVMLIPAAVGFAAGVGLLALAEIIKYLRIIASASIPETFE
jgi:hypothetical protein